MSILEDAGLGPDVGCSADGDVGDRAGGEQRILRGARQRRGTARGRRRQRVVAASAAAAALVALGSGTAGAAAGSAARPSGCQWQAGTACPGPQPVALSAGHVEAKGLASLMSTSQCRVQLGVACYSPTQYHAAYGLDSLYARGVTGAGRTIVVIDPFGSPTIQHDLDVFDKQFGLPDTTVDIRTYGVIPPFDPNNHDQLGWAVESTLDVQYAHAIAPGARIVLLETGVSETQGVTGFPEIMAALKREVDRGDGDVVSMSFGSAEPDFYTPQDGYSSLLALRSAFRDAAARRITLVAGAGDVGAAGINLDNQTLSTVPEVMWPASDPLVTAAGGTQLFLDDNGARTAPDVVWNDGYGATGGGLSAVFPRPAYQRSVRAVVGAQRGIPDISLSSAVDGGAEVYLSIAPDWTGWAIVGGTSEAAPMLAGIAALADQAAGHRLGNLNQALYALQEDGGYGRRTGLIDVTSGDNSFAGVTGYSAGPGYDLASGLGTLDAAGLVPALANAERQPLRNAQ